MFVLSAIFFTFTSINKSIYLHAIKISTYDAYDKIKQEMYCLMILTRVAYFKMFLNYKILTNSLVVKRTKSKFNQVDPDQSQA